MMYIARVGVLLLRQLVRVEDEEGTKLLTLRLPKSERVNLLTPTSGWTKLQSSSKMGLPVQGRPIAVVLRCRSICVPM